MKDDMIIHDTETGRFDSTSECLTKAEWKDLTIRQITALTQDEWKLMPRSIFIKTPKLIRKVTAARYKFSKLEAEETMESLRTIQHRYDYEYARRRKAGEL